MSGLRSAALRVTDGFGRALSGPQALRVVALLTLANALLGFSLPGSRRVDPRLMLAVVYGLGWAVFLTGWALLDWLKRAELGVEGEAWAPPVAAAGMAAFAAWQALCLTAAFSLDV